MFSLVIRSEFSDSCPTLHVTPFPLSALYNVLDVKLEDIVNVSETGVFCTFDEVMLPLKLQDMFPSGLQPVDRHCNCAWSFSVIVVVPVITGMEGFTEIQNRF